MNIKPAHHAPIARTEYSDGVVVVTIMANFLVHLACLTQRPMCLDCPIALKKRARRPPAAEFTDYHPSPAAFLSTPSLLLFCKV